MTDITRCPRCGEIALHIKANGEAICECGHYETHVPKPDPQPTYRTGFMLRQQAE